MEKRAIPRGDHGTRIRPSSSIISGELVLSSFKAECHTPPHNIGSSNSNVIIVVVINAVVTLGGKKEEPQEVGRLEDNSNVGVTQSVADCNSLAMPPGCMFRINSSALRENLAGGSGNEMTRREDGDHTSSPRISAPKKKREENEN